MQGPPFSKGSFQGDIGTLKAKQGALTLRNALLGSENVLLDRKKTSQAKTGPSWAIKGLSQANTLPSQ